jgi:hypothetical protein
VSTLAFFHIHQAISRRDCLNQASERRGPFGRVADEGGDGRVVGANSDDGGIGTFVRRKSSDALNQEYFECECQQRQASISSLCLSRPCLAENVLGRNAEGRRRLPHDTPKPAILTVIRD